MEFWKRFLERVRIDHPTWTKAKKAGSGNWFAMPCPFKGGPYYAFSFGHGGKIRSEIYIDYAGPDRAADLFGALAERRADIERTYGRDLTWEELPERRRESGR